MCVWGGSDGHRKSGLASYCEEVPTGSGSALSAPACRCAAAVSATRSASRSQAVEVCSGPVGGEAVEVR